VTRSVVIALGSGIIVGYFRVLPEWFFRHLDLVIQVSLFALVAGVGMELARNRGAWRAVRALGWPVLFLPATGMAGGIVAALLCAPLFGLSPAQGVTVASAFGWYSLAGVLITDLAGPALGITAFLSNLMREILAFVGAETLNRRLGGWPAVAAGGATSMDTTLVVLNQISAGKLSALGLVSGFIHTLCVPLLLPFWARFL